MSEPGERPERAPDRRGKAREPVVLVVEYEGVDDLLGDYTENLSTGGTFVHTEREFKNGTEVRLMLSFPGLLRPIAIDGVVRWCRESPAEERGVGIEFLGYEEGGRARIEEILRAIRERDPTLVGRLVNVLLVDDNRHVADLIRDGLIQTSDQFGKNFTFSFRMSNNGRDALDLLQGEVFDALIIDVYLPVLEGTAVIAAARRDERHKDMPIVAVSAGGETAREMAMAAGADVFLEKPMRLRQLIGTMKRLLG